MFKHAYTGMFVQLTNGSTLFHTDLEVILVHCGYEYVSENDTYKLTGTNVLGVGETGKEYTLEAVKDMLEHQEAIIYKTINRTVLILNKPAIQMQREFLEIDSYYFPTIQYGEDGKPIPSIKMTVPEEQRDIILGAFCDDPLDVDGTSSLIAFADGDCYAPNGQHSSYSRDFLYNKCWAISIEDYKACSNLYTPEVYVKLLESLDPYETFKQLAMDDEAFPTVPEQKDVFNVVPQ